MAVRVIRHDEGVNEGVVELLLDDPDRGNALNLTAAEALRAAAAEVAGAPGRAVLPRQARNTFRAGGDLRAFARRDGDTGRYVHVVARAAHAAVESLRSLPVPVVVAVRGAAAGGGVGLALTGDLVVAAASTRFRPPTSGTPWGSTSKRRPGSSQPWPRASRPDPHHVVPAGTHRGEGVNP